MSDISVSTRLARAVSSRKRRIRIWSAAVLTIVVLLVIQVAVSTWRPLPVLTDGLAPEIILAIFLTAMLCEYVDSSLGMGYGTMLTPLLLAAGFEPLRIVPCVLLSEFISGLSAGIMHHHDGNVDFLRDHQARRTALLLSMLSVVGAVAAVVFAFRLPTFWLKAAIAIIILSVGVLSLATIRRQFRYRSGHIIAIGVVAAFNKGLSGGGYGPLVTAGQVVSGVAAKGAVAITSLAEALTCIVGLAAYLLLGGTLDLALAVPLMLGAILSVPMATLTVRRLPEGFMRGSVGVFTCLLGIFTLVKLLW